VPSSKRQPLDPARCAVVIVDLQNDFCHEDGAMAKFGEDPVLVRPILPAVHALVRAARERDVPRIYLRVVQHEWFTTPAMHARGRAGDLLGDLDATPLVQEGSWGADFYELEPAPDELIVTKYTYSGFRYTPLELALRTKGRDTVVLAGTHTNACVEATAEDALTHGFYPVVVRECVASGDAALHEAALKDINQRIGPVVALEEVLSVWGVAVAATAPA
jgi:ureidoacrylate peracid hydrolase